MADEERGLGRERPEVDRRCARRAGARSPMATPARALNLLQLAVAAAPQPAGHPRVDLALLEQTLQRKTLRYDKGGEEHFNLISALHKSMRNSDPDAAVYWLARMVEAGEDPLYVARRLVRFASEDVGNADPQALVVAMAARTPCTSSACPRATRRWRRPRIYLATAPKSNAVYLAYGAAAEAARAGRRRAGAAAPAQRADAADEGARLRQGLPVRARRRRRASPTWTACPRASHGRRFYTPTERGFEKEIKRRLEGWKEIKAKRRGAARAER